MIQSLKGFRDILPGDVEVWQHMEMTARDLFEDFGFKEIRPPVMEKTELFKRSIGEETDIVGKEMYTFKSRGGKSITLRPEATASVVRSYIQHKMYAVEPVRKLYTIGPMFRSENPQQGRYRQFYQINAEVFGIASPLIDAQLIFMLMTFFSRLQVKDIGAHINSLGCKKCRPEFHKALSVLLSKVGDSLCDDCNKRSLKNPLRTLDCKVTSCRNALAEAPAIVDFLCEECTEHFDAVKRFLDRQGISFEVDKQLVRGLDYYTRTTFEIQTGLLGAQNAVAGGGRYDGLVKALGGPEQPAIGFAVGCDRLIEIMTLDKKAYMKNPSVFVAALGTQSMDMAYGWVCELNNIGIPTEMDYSGRSLKSQMKRADRMNAAYVLIVGEEEIKKGEAVLRDMNTKEQALIPLNSIVDNLQKALKIRNTKHETRNNIK